MVGECPLNSDSLEENNRLETKRFGDSSTNQLGKLPLPAIGNRRELATRWVRFSLTVGNSVFLGYCCSITFIYFIYQPNCLSSEFLSAYLYLAPWEAALAL